MPAVTPLLQDYGVALAWARSSPNVGPCPSGSRRPHPDVEARTACREPLRRHGRFLGMTSTAEAAKNTIEIGKKHILDQRLRIERQRELIQRHERDGYPGLVADAIRLLGDP